MLHYLTLSDTVKPLRHRTSSNTLDHQMRGAPTCFERHLTSFERAGSFELFMECL
jgi:hypothetical protein